MAAPRRFGIGTSSAVRRSPESDRKKGQCSDGEEGEHLGNRQQVADSNAMKRGVVIL